MRTLFKGALYLTHVRFTTHSIQGRVLFNVRILFKEIRYASCRNYISHHQKCDLLTLRFVAAHTKKVYYNIIPVHSGIIWCNMAILWRKKSQFMNIIINNVCRQYI